MAPSPEQLIEIGKRLRSVGFYVVANDYERGRLPLATVVSYLRRDAPKVTEPTKTERFKLADTLERWL
jgi:hypothetical protein